VSWYGDHVLPRIVDLTCGGTRMHPVRRPALDGLLGTVVELGFGSGPNVGLYPDAVDRVLAVEPSEGARALARKRLARVPHPPVDFVGLDGARLPLEDASADAVLSTFTLCTIPDVDAAMQEVVRVLRPGGALHFLEHGRSDDPEVYRRQVRFEPVQRRIGGGCHLTRDAAELAAAAGLRVDDLARFRLQGPKILTTMSSGRAVKIS
jgi:ubiquinone/menaquinone biosynthesis C-methylase UbiE